MTDDAPAFGMRQKYPRCTEMRSIYPDNFLPGFIVGIELFTQLTCDPDRLRFAPDMNAALRLNVASVIAVISREAHGFDPFTKLTGEADIADSTAFAVSADRGMPMA